MKISPKGQLLTAACFAVLCVGFPSEARAYGINCGQVLGAGVGILALLVFLAALIEALFISLGLRIPYHRVVWLLFGANLASAVSKVPVSMFNAGMYTLLLPRALPEYFKFRPIVILMGIAVFFVVSLAVEYLIVVASCRKRAIPFSGRRVALLLFFANLVTYAILAPWYYSWMRPTHDIWQFTSDSKWAQRPPVALYYISRGGTLRSIMTDGQGEREIVSDTVQDYQYLPDRGIVLYRNAANDLCMFRRQDARRISCWKAGGEAFDMDRVACSPDGRTVAYLTRNGQPTRYELMLYNVESGMRKKTGVAIQHGDSPPPEIAWSQSPSILLLKRNYQIEVIKIDKDMSISWMQLDSSNNVLSEVYGRFSPFGDVSPDDESGGTTAHTISGAGSSLGIEVDGRSFYLGDRFNDRDFNDVCVLEMGREVIFDDRHHIYLLDVRQRKVGTIAEGSDFMILNDRYRRKIRVANN